MTGVTQTSGGKFGNGYTFGSYASNHYMTMPDNADFTFGVGAFTIEFWIKLTATPTSYACVFAHGDASNQEHVLQLGNWDSSNGYNLYWFARGGLGSNMSVSGSSGSNQTGPIAVDTWYHVALVRNSDLWSMYINGNFRKSATQSGTLQDYSNAFHIGRRARNPDRGSFEGVLDDFRITKGVARYSGTTQSDWGNFSEITAPFGTSAAGNSFTESSGISAHTVTASGDATLTNTGVPTESSIRSAGTWAKAMKFDGTGDYMEMASDSDFAFGAVSGTDNDFTVETWIYLNSGETAGNIFDGRVGAASAVVPYLELADSKLKYTVNGAALLTDTTTITTEVWHHITLQRSGSVVHLFLDGALKQSASDTSTYIACPMRIGENFNGWMDEFRVSKGLARHTITATVSGTQTKGIVDPNASAVVLAITGQETVSSGGTLTTSDSTGHTGTLTRNAVQTASGAKWSWSKAYAFPNQSLGSTDNGDRLNIPSHSSFNFGTGDFTVEYWVKHLGSATGNSFYFSHGSTNEFANYSPGTGASAGINSHISWNAATNSTNIRDGEWHHIMYVRENGKMGIGVDGSFGTWNASVESVPARTMRLGDSSYEDEGDTYAPNSMIDAFVLRNTSSGVTKDDTTYTVPTDQYGEVEVDAYIYSGSYTVPAEAYGVGQSTSTTTAVTIPGDIFYDTGKVGLGGQTLPQYDLDITGNLNYTGNLYHNGNLIAPAEETWQFTDPLGGIGEGDDTVGDTLYGNVTLLLHSSSP
jgi:hypothetical protein